MLFTEDHHVVVIIATWPRRKQQASCKVLNLAQKKSHTFGEVDRQSV
jgi:hypothetical protein